MVRPAAALIRKFSSANTRSNANIKVDNQSSKRLALTNEPVRFYSEISLLTTGAVVSVDWDFSGGTNFTGPQTQLNLTSPTNTYANAGSYDVAMRVKYTLASNPSVVQQILRTKTDFIRVVAGPK